jgi:hypothetical protein
VASKNRTGAATNIAAEAVVRAPADGYTLLLVTASDAINATLYDKLSFDFIRDIAPVAGIIRYPLVMQVNPSFPAKTVPEFITVQSRQDQLRIGRLRHVDPCRQRTVQNDGRGRHDPCALSRWRARDDRSHGRTGTGSVQPRTRVDGVHQSGRRLRTRRQPLPNPRQRNFLNTLRAMFKWAVAEGRVPDNPTLGVTREKAKTAGYKTWSEEHIARFEAAHPIGSKARLAFALLLIRDNAAATWSRSAGSISTTTS